MEKNKNNHKNILSFIAEDYKNIFLLLLHANVGTAVNENNCDCFIVVIDINQFHI